MQPNAGSELHIVRCWVAPSLFHLASHSALPLSTAGGFLQSAIFGTSGMRLVSDGLTFNPPPPRATGSTATLMGVTSFHFRGHRMSQEVTEASMTYCVISSKTGAPRLALVVEDDGSSHELRVGMPVQVARARAKIVLK